MTVMADETKPTVHEALAAVMASLPGIGKGAKSPEGYSYRGIEAITKHLQPLLAQHGVLIVPKAEVLATVPSPAMKDGWQDIVMRVEWTIYGPDGTHIEAVTNGIGRDRSDKGSNKAQTQAFKYLLLHLFCIADAKDDADGHTYEDQRRPEWQGATGEQVAEFAGVWEQLSELRKKEYQAWRAKHKIPKLPQASYEQAIRAIEAVRGLLPKSDSGESGVREVPDDTPSETEQESSVDSSPESTTEQEQML
jgi:hypothetical protein